VWWPPSPKCGVLPEPLTKVQVTGGRQHPTQGTLPFIVASARFCWRLRLGDGFCLFFAVLGVSDRFGGVFRASRGLSGGGWGSGFGFPGALTPTAGLLSDLYQVVASPLGGGPRGAVPSVATGLLGGTFSAAPIRILWGFHNNTVKRPLTSRSRIRNCRRSCTRRQERPQASWIGDFRLHHLFQRGLNP